MEHDQAQLKQQVRTYWNQASCGTEFILSPKFSQAYFEDIEQFRYKIEPEIFSFAQFTRFHNKKVLEVGVGAGSDFLQWVRAGAQTYGVDLSEEAIENVQHRLALYGLKAADLTIGDAENLPYPDNSFDLVYSWGVIHHSPNTIKCLEEIVRVTKPGGSIKLMVYNRNSLFAFYRYFKVALLGGKPFKKISSVLYDHQESPGTKAYSFKEIRKIVAVMPVTIVEHKATVSQHDLLYYKSKVFRFFAYAAACLFGWNRVGWFMTIELKKEMSK